MFPILFTGLSLLTCFNVISGYSVGAPVVQCATMTPCHTIPQTGDPPTNITFSSPCYTPSVPLNVDIRGPPFKGIYVQLRKENTSSLAEGTFENLDQEKFKFVSCRPGRNNAFTNRIPRETIQSTFTWTPSARNTGNLELVYTFVQSYYKIWVKAKKSLPKCMETI